MVKISTVPVGAECEGFCGCRFKVVGETRWDDARRTDVVPVRMVETCLQYPSHSEHQPLGSNADIPDGAMWGDVHYDPLAAELEATFGPGNA